MLRKIWDFQASHYLLGIGQDGGAKTSKAADPDQVIKAFKSFTDQRLDIYWAVAGFDGSRKAQNASNIRAFWLDLDCGEQKRYASTDDALRALFAWVEHHRALPPTDIIHSGNGLHVYWVLNEAVPWKTWLPVAQQFKQALRVGEQQVHADPQRTADAASLLRIPGTYNYKDPDNPKKVEQIFASGKTHSFERFKNALPQTGPLGVLPDKKTPLPPEWDIPADYPPSSAVKVSDHCLQIQYFREQGGAVPEPYWRAGLSVIYRCEHGDALIHEWSQGDERYNPRQTQAKAENTHGPATCVHFADVNPEGCTGCKQKVTSPIQLGITAPPAPVPETAPDWQFNEVNRYSTTDDGIWYQSAEEPAQRVSFIPIWVTEVRERARAGTEADVSSIVLQWRGVDNRVKRGVLTQSSVHDLRLFKTWLADHNIISAVQEVKLLVAYISQYTLKLIKNKGSTEYHNSLGWCEHGFVIGDTVVTRDDAQPALVQSSNPIARITPKGDVEEWKRAAAVLDKPEYQNHALTLLLGFGSPLYTLADVHSAVVALVGTSGAGKTLAAQMALSIYGDPVFLGQGSASTINAIEVQLVANRHVPYLLDEVSGYPATKLAEFIYLAANGQGKAALKRNREYRTAGTWRLTPFMTSNPSILEVDQANIQEAHRRRLLELPFHEAFPKEDAAFIYKTMIKNAGSAGVVYLQTLNKVRNSLPELYDQAYEKISNMIDEIPDANRFGMWSLTAAYLGGCLAKQAGLIDYDVDALIKKALRDLKGDAAETKSYADIAQGVLNEYIARNSRRICYWASKTNDLGEPVEDPAVRVYENGEVAVHATELHKEWYDNRITRALIRDWLGENLINTKAVRLAPGTPPIRSYVFRAKTTGLSENVRP